MQSLPTQGASAPRPAREVTDDELAEAAARVRRHAWKERGAMGAGMVFGFGGIAGWFASGTVLVFIAGLAVGALVFRVLSPRGSPLDDEPAGPIDPELRRAGGGVHARGVFGWLGTHAIIQVLGGVCALAGIIGGLFFPGKLIGDALENPLQGMIIGAVIGGTVLGFVGGFGGRLIGRRLFPRASSPFE